LLHSIRDRGVISRTFGPHPMDSRLLAPALLGVERVMSHPAAFV
jgi:hypothetical protein